MYEEFIRKVIMNHKGNDGTALDFGAHKGLYTEILSDKFTEYYGFEPHQDNITHLRDNYKLPNAHFVQKVVGRNDAQEKYFLNDNSAYNSIAYSHSKTDETFIMVDSTTIDTFCQGKTVSFIKCDIQGAENSIFQYGINTLSNNKIDICLEVHQGTNHKSLFSFFHSLNYKIYDKQFKQIGVDILTGTENHFDTFFITNRGIELHEILDFGSKMISSGHHVNINHYLFLRPPTAGRTENIVRINSFLQSDVINTIVNKIEEKNDDLQPSVLVRPTLDERVRNKGKSLGKNRILHHDDILDKLMWLNNEHFRFDLTYAQFRYIVYDKDDFFNWHPDSTIAFQPGFCYYPGKDVVYRKLTAIISLTDMSDYDGGELYILNGSHQPENSIMSVGQLNKGDLILFPSFFSHKVSAINSGVRKSLVVWLSGPRWR